MSALIPPVFRVLSILLKAKAADVESLQDALAGYETDLTSADNPDYWHFAPMCFTRLSEAGMLDVLSASLAETLKHAAKTAAMQSIARDLALTKLAQALREGECEAILLKGAALDKYLYQREDFRMGVDVDILIRSEDFDRVDDLFANCAEPVNVFGQRQAHADAAAQRSFSIAGPTPVSVDVHQQFAQDGIFMADYDEIFNRSISKPETPVGFRIMSPEDNLLHFALHGFKEKCLFHKQTVDTWLLLNREKIDWKTTVSRAKSWGVFLPLVYLLEGVRQVFQYELPNEVSSVLSLKGSRRQLVLHFLGERPPSDVRTGVSYRAQQLAISWLLSGNVSGYLRYQGRYMVNRVRDYFYS